MLVKHISNTIPPDTSLHHPGEALPLFFFFFFKYCGIRSWLIWICNNAALLIAAALSVHSLLLAGDLGQYVVWKLKRNATCKGSSSSEIISLLFPVSRLTQTWRSLMHHHRSFCPVTGAGIGMAPWHGWSQAHHTTICKRICSQGPSTGRRHPFKLGNTITSFNFCKLRSLGTEHHVRVINSLYSLLSLLPPSPPWRLKRKQDYKGDWIGHISGVLF